MTTIDPPSTNAARRIPEKTCWEMFLSDMGASSYARHGLGVVYG